MVFDEQAEWLEADGLGGFASGTVGLVRSRRYHALLLTATTPPTGRVVLVSGFDAVAQTIAGTAAISSQHYLPDVRHPDGRRRIRAFTGEPWPTWEFDLPDGSCLRQEILVQHGAGVVVVRWTAVGARGPLSLRVRPLLSGRDYHGLVQENGAFDFAATMAGCALRIQPYRGLPAVEWRANGTFQPGAVWYRHFLYQHERDRGLDASEDLASPGELTFEITSDQPAVWLLRASQEPGPASCSRDQVLAQAAGIVDDERARRAAFPSSSHRAADAYVVSRGRGRTIIAGYPWFTDWGRDTFIAMRGLCLSTGRLQDARQILVEWAGAVSRGMLPNRFPDHGEAPEFNAVDASLWYVVAVREFLERAGTSRRHISASERRQLEAATLAIVDGYAAGTRFGIRMDEDGLLAAGEAGLQLTWMDARVGDRVITPRVGKPVEIQALWVNALAAAARIEPGRAALTERAVRAFGERFWYDDGGYLYDVVDVDHVRGAVDASFRPNQILAVGGLPVPLVTGDRARRIVQAVEEHLLVPLGLRSLAAGTPGYVARYEGDSAARDGAYHQGTVWPWLLGPFVEAWTRVHRLTPTDLAAARERFLSPLRAHAQRAGLGHVSEIVDAEVPFTPRGCPFQAWSLGEWLRLDLDVLVPPSRTKRPRSSARRVIAAATVAHA